MDRRKLMLGSTAVIASAFPVQAQSEFFRAEIERIINLVSKIRPGQQRADLHDDWIPDGGLQVPHSTRYTLKTCQSVKIDVDFQKTDSDPFNDPRALIAKVSRPYLQFPIFD